MLTETSHISNEHFLENIKKIHHCGKIIVCCTGSNPSLDDFLIIGSGTAFIETKIIRGGQSASHIEDVVVYEKYRGSGIAKKIIKFLVEYSKNIGCYKVILDTQDKTVSFYEKCGFLVKGKQMGMYLYK